MMKLLRYFLIAILSISFLSLHSCTKEDNGQISVELKSSTLMFYQGDRIGHVQIKTEPGDLLSLKKSAVELVTSNGAPSPHLSVNDVRDAGNGLWDLDVKVASSISTSAPFMVKVSRGKHSAMTQSVTAMYGVPGITEVSVLGRKANYDEKTKTFELVVPAVNDFSAVPVSFTAGAEKVLCGTTELRSGSSKLNLSEAVTLSAIIGDEQMDYTLKVRNTGIPSVFITTPKPITSKTEWMEGASIRIENADGTVDFEGPMSIRGRGNSTWNYVKKPYAIKLESKSKILGMPKHKRWVLLANWKDRTIMRNDAAFWLSRHSGLEYTVRGEFVEVVLNGEHVGNYYLCEQIKIDKNRVNITEMDPQETDPELITGGYLLEIDTYYDEVNRFKSKRFSLPYMFKEPDEEDLSKEAFNYLKNYVSELEDILKDQTRLNNHEYEDYLDVDTCIDYMLVEELTNNTDFYNTWPYPGTHSCYMYKDRGGKLMHGPIWDFDYHGFVPGLSGFWAGATKTLYYPALTKDPKFRERMIERWNMQKESFRQLPGYIDEVADYIRDSEAINHELWPIDTNWENGDENMTFQQAVDRIKEGFLKKWEWIDKNIAYLK